MRRVILISGLIGVAANVLIAWLLAYADYPTGAAVHQGPTAWIGDVPAEWGSTTRRSSAVNGFGKSRISLVLDRPLADPPSVVQTHCQFGLPFRSICYVEASALLSVVVADPTPPSDLESGLNLSATLGVQGAGRRVVLPILPLWIGFVANSAIYGLASLVFILVFRRLNAWRLRARNRCDSCGHQCLPVVVQCPECGQCMAG
jgi:hypothetical protein